MKILFIDDQYCMPEMQSVIRGNYGELQTEGHEFLYETAFNGKEYSFRTVIDRVTHEQPDVVITDMSFGEGPTYWGTFGRGVVQIMTREFPHIPVIVHSSESNPSLIQECMGYGMRAWLPKMVPLGQLRSTLEEIAKR